MKRIYFATILGLFSILPVLATQPGERYASSYSSRSQDGWGDYGRGKYFGVRLGLAVASVHSDDPLLDGGGRQSGLDLGFVAGVQLGNAVPICLESGLQYVQKGGKGYNEGTKFTYDLNYLEVPVVIKYKYFFDENMAIQPFFGGFFSCGVGGKIKNFEERNTQHSFSRSQFQRVDGGLRVGCGFSYSSLYLDMSYDIGLANIGHDAFETSRTGCFYVTIGVDF